MENVRTSSDIVSEERCAIAIRLPCKDVPYFFASMNDLGSSSKHLKLMAAELSPDLPAHINENHLGTTFLRFGSSEAG